jgi:cytochrome c556
MIIGIRCVVLGVAMAAALGPTAFAAKRARPPEWSPDVLDAFFADAREKLEGPRPDYELRGTTTGEPASAGGGLSDAKSAPTIFAWSKLIDADTLESEVKRLSQSLDAAVTTPSEFKGGGYKLARRDFSVLAVLFAVTGQYDGQARWQDDAAGFREVLSRAGYNAKVGTDQTYREASERKQNLTDLVRGSRPQVPNAEVAVADWAQVADRQPLMQRINIAHEERLTKWLADAATFRRNRDDVHHEAQIIAMLAEVIHREGFEFWDDETFAEYAEKLRQAASDVAAAAAADNYNQARDAVNRATNACADCHDGYRE